MEHELKTWVPFFQDIADGRKTFEVRKNDRGFVIEDILWLREWRMVAEAYTGRELKVPVCYVLEGGSFGIAEGCCILGLRMGEIEHIGHLHSPHISTKGGE